MKIKLLINNKVILYLLIILLYYLWTKFQLYRIIIVKRPIFTNIKLMSLLKIINNYYSLSIKQKIILADGN